MVSPKAGRDVSERPVPHTNGASSGNNSSGGGGRFQRLPAGQRQMAEEPDPLEDLDLEEGPLLGASNRDRATFELQGFQGPSDSAGYGDGDRSILGGQYTGSDTRRRCCAGLLSVTAAVLLVAVVLIGGFGAFEWRDSIRHTYDNLDLGPPGAGSLPPPDEFLPPEFDSSPDAAAAGGLPAPAPTAEPTAAPTPAPTEAPTPAPTAAPTAKPTEAPTDAPAESGSPAAGPDSGAFARAPESADGAAPAPEAAGAQQPAPAADSPNSSAQQPAPDAQDTFHEDEFGSGDASQPWSRWIYKLPKTWTQDDYDATKAASDLAYSHMAMLTLLPDGRLASLMQASTVPGEGNAEQTLYWQTSGDGGLTWSPPVAPLPPVTGPSGQQLPLWSPVLHTQNGTVHLFFSASVEECQFLVETAYRTRRWTPGGNIMHAHSTDGGESWSVPRVIYGFSDEGGIPKVIANKLAVGGNGEWLLPFWRENDPWDAGPECNLQRNLMGVPAVLISRDQGETWTASQSISHGGALPYNWMIENTIAAATPGAREPQPGQFLQMFRTDPGTPIYASRSADGGATWSVARPTLLPNPNSKVHLLGLPGGGLLLAFDDDARLRTPLALAMSRDGGDSWTRVGAIEGHPCGQFSYPTVQLAPEGGRVYVAYTVLFLPAAMPTACRERFGKTGSNTTEGLPASGMRVYGTTLDLLNAAFEAGNRR